MRDGMNSKRHQRAYAKRTGTPCRARGSHQDALALVEYLLDHGGKSNLTQGQLAEALKWEQRVGNTRVIDMGRFQRAKNHVKDGLDKDDKPCTGFSLHYRPSAPDNVWRLVDPAGNLAHHREVARGEILGDIQQQLSWRTVNGRRKETANSMAEMCLKANPPDYVGHRVMLSYAMEIEKFGTVTDATIAELMVWIEHS